MEEEEILNISAGMDLHNGGSGDRGHQFARMDLHEGGSGDPKHQFARMDLHEGGSGDPKHQFARMDLHERGSESLTDILISSQIFTVFLLLYKCFLPLALSKAYLPKLCPLFLSCPNENALIF